MDSISVAEKMMVASTEDVVLAFMRTLFSIPIRSDLRRLSITPPPPPPSLDQHKDVATQMHGVVLLYNYYQRKHNQDLKFLNWASFCNLAVVIHPYLAPFMKFPDLNDDESQLSLTEKAIAKACDIAAGLDASLEVPNIQAWPISKVAVLLIDSSKKNCKLQMSGVTQGVWSLFEEELDGFPIGPEISSGNKREIEAVSRITGIEINELVVLGSHITYSLSEEKSATRLYFVQVPGNGTIRGEERIPLDILLQRMKGPLVEYAFTLKIWFTPEVVQFYHMLPYAEFISGWLSRIQEQEEEHMSIKDNQEKDNLVDGSLTNSLERKTEIEPATMEDDEATLTVTGTDQNVCTTETTKKNIPEENIVRSRSGRIIQKNRKYFSTSPELEWDYNPAHFE